MDRSDFNGKTFKLTRDHVYEGIRKDGWGCPLAITLRDFLISDMNIDDEIQIAVQFEYAEIYNDNGDCEHYFLLDDAITDFIHDFDNEYIAYKEFQGRTVRIETLENQHHKLFFV